MTFNIKITSLVFLGFCCLVTLIPYSYRYWPAGQAQDYALIWVKGEQLAELFDYSEKLGITAAKICLKKGAFSDWVDINGVRITENGKDDTFFSLRKKMKEAEFSCFRAKKIEGNWSVPGSTGDKSVNIGYYKSEKMVQRHYLLSDNDFDIGCNEIIENGFNIGVCTRKMFGHWFVREYWYQ